MSKCCGTCKWWTPRDSQGDAGDCHEADTKFADCPAIQTVITYIDEGADCPLYEEKNDERKD